MNLSTKQQVFIDSILNGENVFLTGKAGTGKSFVVNKAIEEYKKGKTCVLLIPVSTSTKLFHDIILPNATEIRFVKGRISFDKINESGERYKPKKSGNPLDSMIVIFKPSLSV